MKTIQGPGIFLAQFIGAEPPFDKLETMAKWVASMGYVGGKDIKDYQEKATFVRISGAGLRESHAHDVTITRESPNYPGAL